MNIHLVLAKFSFKNRLTSFVLRILLGWYQSKSYNLITSFPITKSVTLVKNLLVLIVVSNETLL